MKLVPPLGYTIIKAEDVPKKSPGGVVLPDNYEETIRKGVVVGVTDNDAGEGIEFPLGAAVLFSYEDAICFQHDDKDYYRVEDEDIIVALMDE